MQLGLCVGPSSDSETPSVSSIYRDAGRMRLRVEARRHGASSWLSLFALALLALRSTVFAAEQGSSSSGSSEGPVSSSNGAVVSAKVNPQVALSNPDYATQRACMTCALHMLALDPGAQHILLYFTDHQYHHHRHARRSPRLIFSGPRACSAGPACAQLGGEPFRHSGTRPTSAAASGGLRRLGMRWESMRSLYPRSALHPLALCGPQAS